jgi:hypothetical protein
VNVFFVAQLIELHKMAHKMALNERILALVWSRRNCTQLQRCSATERITRSFRVTATFRKCLRSVAHVIPRPPAHGTLADVMACTLEKTGVIWVHPKRTKWCEVGPRQHGLRDLIVALVTNFPTLLVCQPRGQEVRFNATPSDHPITATVTQHGRLAVTTSGLDPPRHVKVCSQPELVLQLQLTARPKVEITRVHPHPHLSCRVSLWAAGRRRRLPRKHYKGFVKHAATNRGHDQIRQRAQKWSETSATAAQGLVTLEWKRIRRVLDLGPWGEQIIYRNKTRAFSLYDVRNERHGCPHASCRHEVDVDLHHVFWTCPAARRLRAVFVSAWKRLRLPDRETEQACFGLELPMVLPALWEANSRNGQDDRTVEMAECVTALAEGCCFLFCFEVRYINVI